MHFYKFEWNGREFFELVYSDAQRFTIGSTYQFTVTEDSDKEESTPVPIHSCIATEKPVVQIKHGYTPHGWACCRQALIGEQPEMRARCGGPRTCAKCAADAYALCGNAARNG